MKYQAGIHNDKMIPGLKRLVDEVHSNSGKIAFQLAHGGRQVPRKLIGLRPLAPSGKGRDPISLNKAKKMDESEIEDVIFAFVEAARLINPVLGKKAMMLVGGLKRFGQFEELIEKNWTVFLSMSRALNMEPFLIKKFRDGKKREASCISCNRCFAAVFNDLPLKCYAKGIPGIS